METKRRRSRKVSRAAFLALAFAALGAGAAMAAPPEKMPVPEKAFLVVVDGQGVLHIQPLGAPGAINDLRKRTALADPCNGGSCQTPSGVILSCPSSGGSACTGTTACGCQCALAGVYVHYWAAANVCADIV